MIRALVTFAMLTVAPAALACGGQPCDHCAHGAQEATASVDVNAAAGTHVVLDVAGMHCGACSAKITTALTALAGVNAANVDFDAGTAQVAFDPTTTDVAAIIAAVATAGDFTATQNTDS